MDEMDEEVELEILSNQEDSDESDFETRDSDEEEYLDKYGEQYEKDFPEGRNTKHSRKYLAIQKNRRELIDRILKIRLNEELVEAVEKFEAAQDEYEQKKSKRGGKEMEEQMHEFQECRKDKFEIGFLLFELDLYRSDESPDNNIVDKNNAALSLEYYQGEKFKIYMSNLVETDKLKKRLADIETRMKELDKNLEKIDETGLQADFNKCLEERTEMIVCAEELGMDFDKVLDFEEYDFLKTFPCLMDNLQRVREILRKERRLVKKENVQFAKKDFEQLEVARMKLDKANSELVRKIKRVDAMMKYIEIHRDKLADFDFYNPPKQYDGVENFDEEPPFGTSPPQKKPRHEDEPNKSPQEDASGEGTSSR